MMLTFYKLNSNKKRIKVKNKNINEKRRILWYTMINNNKNLFLLIFIYCFCGIIGYICLKYIFNIIDVYYDFVIYILLIIYILLAIFYLYKKQNLIIVLYYITLFIFLFFRKSEGNYNFNFYILKWLQNINNPIIFLNIIGNIILFIPMGFYTRNVLISFLVIFILEVMQLLLGKGVFDIVDIFLNMIGVIVGNIEDILWKKIKK